MKKPLSSVLQLLFCIFLLITDHVASAQATEAWYIRRYPPEPWTWAPILNTNITEMDEVFGEDGWHSGYFDEVDVAEAFGPTTCFVFLEGGDDHAIPLNDFLMEHMDAIESWVSSGGSLFLNAAPNAGINIDFGFNGVMLIYPFYASSGSAVDDTHPIFNGPYIPTGTSWSGNYFGHAVIEGPGIVPLITDDATGTAVCAEQSWGAGKVIFGGMTVTSWHDPAPEAVNMRQNILKYLAQYAFLDFSYPDSIYCSYESDLIYPVFAEGADTGTFTSEPPGLVIDPVTGALDIDASLPGTYSIQNNFEGVGCKSDSSQTAITIVVPAEAVALESFSMCNGDTVLLTSYGGESYEWIPHDYLEDPFAQNTNIENPPSDMYYQLVITDENGCTDTDEVYITLYDDPIIDAGEDQFILAGSYVELNASGGVVYSWTPEESLSDPDVQNPLSYAIENTTYYVTGTDDHGCSGMDSVHVWLREDALFGFPNAFSPNSDGVNDFYLPIAYGTIATFDLRIYNRWGELVYENINDITKGWDGTFEEKDQPVGSYIYDFSATDGLGKQYIYQGNITLVR